jgi:hypothetical protein
VIKLKKGGKRRMKKIIFRIADLIVLSALFVLYEIVHCIAWLLGEREEYYV